MPDNKPESYNDARLDEISREVFYKSLVAIKGELAASAPSNEKLRAFAAVADAASCGFDDGEEKEAS